MIETCPNQTIPIARPVPGTDAYWSTQREAFALIEAWQTTEPGNPWVELDALRRIAAHPSAAGVMHALGRTVALWISELEVMEADRYRSSPVADDWDDAPETEPKGDDWCSRGCRTYQSRDGICELCGRDAEGFEPAVPAGSPSIGHGAGPVPCCQLTAGEEAPAQP